MHGEEAVVGVASFTRLGSGVSSSRRRRRAKVPPRKRSPGGGHQVHDPDALVVGRGEPAAQRGVVIQIALVRPPLRWPRCLHRRRSSPSRLAHEPSPRLRMYSTSAAVSAGSSLTLIGGHEGVEPCHDLLVGIHHGPGEVGGVRPHTVPIRQRYHAHPQTAPGGADVGRAVHGVARQADHARRPRSDPARPGPRPGAVGRWAGIPGCSRDRGRGQRRPARRRRRRGSGPPRGPASSSAPCRTAQRTPGDRSRGRSPGTRWRCRCPGPHPASAGSGDVEAVDDVPGGEEEAHRPPGRNVEGVHRRPPVGVGELPHPLLGGDVDL